MNQAANSVAICIFVVGLSIFGSTNLSSASELIRAARDGDEDKVTGLLARGAAVNESDTQGRTALMWAALNGRVGIVRLLLEADADVNAVSSDGDTALMAAAFKGYDSTVELLLRRGADADRKNKDGVTAVDIAMARRNLKIAEMIQHRDRRCQPPWYWTGSACIREQR